MSYRYRTPITVTIFTGRIAFEIWDELSDFFYVFY